MKLQFRGFSTSLDKKNPHKIPAINHSRWAIHSNINQLSEDERIDILFFAVHQLISLKLISSPTNVDQFTFYGLVLKRTAEKHTQKKSAMRECKWIFIVDKANSTAYTSWIQ